MSADVSGLGCWAESFHQNFVQTGQAVSEEIANIFSHRFGPKLKLFWQVGLTNKILKGDHLTCDLRTIPTKLGLNWPNSLREEF